MVLLDTCALIWMSSKAPVSPKAQRIISQANAKGMLYLSPVSAWEIGLLARRNKILLNSPVEAYIRHVFSRPGVRIATLTPEIAVRSSFLPGDFHDDPGDRLLITTAVVMGLQFITRDQRILDYGAQGYASVLPC